MAFIKYLFLLFLICFPTVSAFVLKLIHRDSINYSSRFDQLSRQGFSHPMSRSAILEENITGDAGGGGGPVDISASLRHKPGRSVLFVEFFIKDTSYRVLAVMDTGSSLTWVHCIPCMTCGRANSRIYDQRTSSTYRNINCKSPYCDALSNPRCDAQGNCGYKINYSAAPPTIGSLSAESFIFKTSDDGLVTIPNVVFGCSHQSVEQPDLVMGVVGLSAKITSFASQFGGKFSYCVGNINDRAFESSHLAFGDAATFDGDVTPLSVGPHDGCYYVDLEGISLGGKMINVPTETFRRRDSIGGAMIDSGHELTILPNEVYEIVAEEVRKTALLEFQFKGVDGIRRLCLIGNMTTDMDGFPILRFHFLGGAELAMDVNDLFSQVESAAFCMTLATHIHPPGQSYFTLGINAQQNYNIGINRFAKKLYIQRIECELLID